MRNVCSRTYASRSIDHRKRGLDFQKSSPLRACTTANDDDHRPMTQNTMLITAELLPHRVRVKRRYSYHTGRVPLFL